MNFFDDFDLDSPIIACCSGTSTNVGVSKIRLSGNFNLPLILPYFSLNPDFSPKPRFCYYLKLVVNNEVLDDLIFIYFPLNFSFTGQQTIELDVHGNVLNVNRIIDFFINTFGFRLARPGEFSYRAYKNKKLSFNEIEGLDLFLNAKSLYALTHGRSLMKGDLYLKIQDLYTSFLHHRSSIEINIDFFEDLGEQKSSEILLSSFYEFKNKLFNFKTSISQTSSLLEPAVAFLGSPNSGKSTFFNLVLGHNRSIVSSTAGTTRDYVSEWFNFKGLELKIIDTAGLRFSTDEIESIGINSSFHLANRSFFNVYFINPFIFFENLDNSLTNLKNKIDLIIFTHKDLPNFDSYFVKVLDFLKSSFGSIEPLNDLGSIEPSQIHFSSGSIEPNNIFYYLMSSLNVSDFNPCKDLLFYFIKLKFDQIAQESPILLERHRESFSTLFELTKAYEETINTVTDIGIIANEINEISSEISSLVGIFPGESVLNHIFDNFCIGK